MWATWTASVRFVDTELDRPRWRSTASWRALPSLQVGVEYNPAAGEFGPIATWFLLQEGDRNPAVFLGTSSDRIGSPEGTQGYYLTVAKSFAAVPVSPYVTLHWSEWDDRFNVPFGAHVHLPAGFSIQPMYDGDRSHLLGSWSGERVSLTAMWVWYERVGAAVAFGF